MPSDTQPNCPLPPFWLNCWASDWKGRALAQLIDQPLGKATHLVLRLRGPSTARKISPARYSGLPILALRLARRVY